MRCFLGPRALRLRHHFVHEQRRAADQTRSDDPHVAAALFLAAATRRNRASPGRGAGRRGRARWWQAPGEGDLRGLAALGSAYAGCVTDNGFPETSLEEVTLGDDLYTSAITMYGETLYLASIGARFPRQKEAAETLCRILAPALC
jgi:hypothetical protein